MSTNIYILKLQNGNFYIGKSATPEARIQQHFNGAGSAWTKLHKPLKVEKVISGASPYDEDRYVKEYMAKHGIDKVRGGSYANPDLDDLQEQALQRELRGAADACIRCGRKGHFAPNCYARTDISGYELDDSSEDEDDDDDTCYRCGRPGHYANNCYARKDVDGNELSDDD